MASAAAVERDIARSESASDIGRVPAPENRFKRGTLRASACLADACETMRPCSRYWMWLQLSSLTKAVI